MDERRTEMREAEVRDRAFAMPLTNPAFPPGPYRFIDREYLIVTYRTDPAKLRAVVPEPLQIDARDPLVRNVMLEETVDGEFTTLEDVAEAAVIPASFR